MSPVDAIQPPKKVRKVMPVKKTTGAPEKVAPRQVLPPEAKKKQTMWLLVGVTTVIIIVGWVLLFQGGQLTKTGGGGAFGILGQKLTNLWETIKTDVLKLKSAQKTTVPATDDERIKQLEQQVFPQFTDPTKQ